MAERRRPSANEGRARRLLAGAALGGHAAAAVAVVAFLAARGVPSALSAALAAGIVLAFNIIGMAVQVLTADAPAKTVFGATMASYAIRVGLLGVALLAWQANRARFAWVDPLAVAVTTVAVVVCWLAAEIWVYAHLRIPIYDVDEPS